MQLPGGHGAVRGRRLARAVLQPVRWPPSGGCQTMAALRSPAIRPWPPTAASTDRCSETVAGSAALTTGPTGPTPSDGYMYLFDTQGFLLLTDVLSKTECETVLSRLYELEDVDYEDAWVDELGLDRKQVALTKQSSSADLQGADFQTRLNGLPKIDSSTGTFDPMIAHPRILPYLEAFMVEPQLVNIWTITKHQGSGAGGFHAGAQPHNFAVDAHAQGKITTRMLNVVWLLTDNCTDWRRGDGVAAGEPQSALLSHRPPQRRGRQEVHVTVQTFESFARRR